MRNDTRTTRRTRPMHASVRAARSAFTLLELLVSILIVGVLISLLILGLRAASLGTRSVVERQAVQSVRLGLEQFKEAFNFAPPLVKDQANPADRTVTAGGRTFIAVYRVTNAADQDTLRTPGGSLGPPPGDNPLRDNRYSLQSLAYYLAGGADMPAGGANTALVVDGVRGPGLYKPQRDGSFEIPADVETGSTATTARAGTSYEPFVELTDRGVRLFVDPTDIEIAELRDRKDKPLRYYRWLPGREQPANSGNYIVETVADLNVPAMVARRAGVLPQTVPADRDLDLLNVQIRDAQWAIVSAGPNGVFGDEDIAVIARELGATVPSDPQEILVLRARAERDNIIEVGN